MACKGSAVRSCRNDIRSMSLTDASKTGLHRQRATSQRGSCQNREDPWLYQGTAHADERGEIEDAKKMKSCTQCGKCCTNESFMGTLSASYEDVERWEVEGRDDILAWESAYDLWISPRTGYEASRCPFVRKVRGQEKYKCMIYDTRPEVCRQYPTRVDHMAFVGCEMLEVGDTDVVIEAGNSNDAGYE